MAPRQHGTTGSSPRTGRTRTGAFVAGATRVYGNFCLSDDAFLHLKGWRGIATHYNKNLASFLAAAQIRCLALSL
jgi:hypothetical protein